MRMRQWIMGFQETQEISWLAKDLSASPERLCTIQVVFMPNPSSSCWFLIFLTFLLRRERKTVPYLTMLSCAKVIHSWKYIHEWLCNIRGMTVTRKHRGNWRKMSPTAALYDTNPTRTEVGLNPGLRSEGPATIGL
jgi:hypothetical protein